jgi:hypothetical protein
VATVGPCEQGGADPHLLACSAQPEADHSDSSTVAYGLPAGDPAAVNCGGRAGEAWYKKRDGTVGSGGGRPEETERRWPWSSTGRPWWWYAPVAERGREVVRLGHERVARVVTSSTRPRMVGWRRNSGDRRAPLGGHGGAEGVRVSGSAEWSSASSLGLSISTQAKARARTRGGHAAAAHCHGRTNSSAWRARRHMVGHLAGVVVTMLGGRFGSVRV